MAQTSTGFMSDTLNKKIESLFVVGFAGHVLPMDHAEHGYLGYILFSRNMADDAQVKALTSSALPVEKGGPLFFVDQEGGRVERIKSHPLPPARHWGTLDDPMATLQAAEALGRHLSALGFHADFAPILDVDTNPKNPIIGDRSFSREPDAVVVHALAFAQGLNQAGILNCGKHFPGHGDTLVDSHLALPVIEHPLERLRKIELLPFKALAKSLDSIMTAHVLSRALDADHVATFSSKTLRILRDEFGFEGVIFSDDLEMHAVSQTYGLERSTEMALKAGCDAVLICSEYERVTDVVNHLEQLCTSEPQMLSRIEEAYGRVQRMRDKVRGAA